VVVLPEWRPPPAYGGEGADPAKSARGEQMRMGESRNKRKREEVRGLPASREVRRRRRSREVAGDAGGRGSGCRRAGSDGRGRGEDCACEGAASECAASRGSRERRLERTDWTVQQGSREFLFFGRI